MVKRRESSIDIKAIVDQIPYILQYFVPGFLALSLYCFIASRKIDNTAYIVGISVVISYAIHLLCRSIIHHNTIALVIVESLLGFVLGLSSYKIIHSNPFKLVLRKISEKDIEDNMLRKVTDFDLGTIVQIYDRNQRTFYTGVLFSMDERDTEPWIALSNYSMFKVDENGKLGEEIPQTERMNKLLLIKLSNASQIELLYEDNTKIFKQFK